MSGRFTNSFSFTGVMFLANTVEDNGFKRLADFLEENQLYNKVENDYWRLLSIKRNKSLILSIDECLIIIVASRQLVTKNNLEILALGTTNDFSPERNTEQIIEDVSMNGAIPVLPWGVGKWLGKRGKTVSKLLQNSNLPRLFIGDSANRPVFWPEPSQFGLARANGIKNLPGSDPLPVKNGYKNAGKAGIVLKDSINLDDPVNSLKSRLLDPSTDIQPYIKRENPISFFRNQFAMQYKKYFGYDNKQKS